MRESKSDFKSASASGPEVGDVPMGLKDRALAVAAEGITINDLRLPDEPLIYANDGFERLTLYPVKDIIGRNCRFLQGPDTDSSVVDQIRDAVRERRECTVEILNYRKDGKPFWNRLSLTPVRNDEGETTHYIGVQSDITESREAKIALSQANRKLEETNERMRRDLEAAAKIQQSLLPEGLPEFKEASITWVFEPCDELAGDTLNVFPVDREHIALYTLDVSGHGVQAALLSVSLSHWLSPSNGPRSSLFVPVPGSDSELVLASPRQVVESLNQQFPMNKDTIQYFTITYGLLNRFTGELRYAVAGSPRPLLHSRTDQARILRGGGLPIGMVSQPEYQEKVIRLSGGDRVFFYTDGICEAENAAGEPFWTDRLVAAVDEGRDRTLDECVKSVLDEVREWNDGDRFNDDATILALEFRGES